MYDRAVPGWAAWGLSDTGYVRERNEDAFAVDAGLGCYLVADGLGGHRGGEVASRLARDTVLAALAEAGAAADAGAVLAGAMDAANSAIRRAAEADPALLGMATTVSLLWLPPWDGEGRGWVAHAGDSRVYRLGQGGLIQLTDDHNRAGEMVRAGAMTPARAERSLLSHGITRAAGIDAALEADVFALGTADAEAFLLCSDGLS
ncbi:MAG: serine/threonine-protein phosphatase, partial [Proteobacteria bacterium]|nr:serine/threonine-protein phosphatase [Pseudomonadota bacterium]